MTNMQMAAMPGIIAIDLDGTAFTTDHRSMTPRTFQVLSACLATGTSVVPTTGRCESVIPLDALPPVRHIISCNGGLITERPSGKILRAQYIPKADVRAAWELVRERVRSHDLVVELFEERQIVVERKILDNAAHYESKIPTFHRPLILGGMAKYVDSIDRYIEEEGEKVVKINFPGKNIERCPEIRAELLALDLFEISSDGLNLEATAKGCDKGEALLWLSDHLQVNHKDTVAFGDSYNDLPMLHAAGYGVAMGNASEEVKQAARYSTASNKEDGIAKFLEQKFAIRS